MRRRRAKSRFWVLIICAMTIAFSVTFIASAIKISRLNGECSALKQARDQLLATRGEMEQTQQYMQTDQYVEDVARKKLGMIYYNEIKYVSN